MPSSRIVSDAGSTVLSSRSTNFDTRLYGAPAGLPVELVGQLESLPLAV
jgi:hypothetical protein